MVWTKDRELHPEDEQRFQEPARVMLMLCGPEILVQAEMKDERIESWLSEVKVNVAG